MMRKHPTACCAIPLLALSLLVGVAHGQTLQTWMNPEVGDAWAAGYKGLNTTITVIDDFKSSSRLNGNLGVGPFSQRHGEWTRLESALLAPLASLHARDFLSGTTVPLAADLNVLNLSYGMFARKGYKVNQINWSAQEQSIISYAANGNAVISKAAGNDAVAVGGVTASGTVDYLAKALIGTPSGIFVGALSSNGSTTSLARLASYSNFAGSNTAVQKNFLVVGVEGSKTGLYGTSFAAPVITGYAAILGSKFTTATPTQVANQLLVTARQDTLADYSAAKYGRGEASLTRALAPVTIR